VRAEASGRIEICADPEGFVCGTITNARTERTRTSNSKKFRTIFNSPFKDEVKKEHRFFSEDVFTTSLKRRSGPKKGEREKGAPEKGRKRRLADQLSPNIWTYVEKLYKKMYDV